jgi:SAM-dependent methyltransferase
MQEIKMVKTHPAMDYAFYVCPTSKRVLEFQPGALCCAACSRSYSDAFFDFAICSGALHLFPNPVAALKEICRTLKPRARLVGLTFSSGSQGLIRYDWFRERVKKRGTIHLFRIPELESSFNQAGFDQPEMLFMGSGIFFQAEKL